MTDHAEIYKYMERRDDKMNVKLDKILEGQSDYSERLVAVEKDVESVEKTIEPLCDKVDGHGVAINRAWGAIAFVTLLFGGIGAASALGMI